MKATAAFNVEVRNVVVSFNDFMATDANLFSSHFGTLMLCSVHREESSLSLSSAYTVYHMRRFNGYVLIRRNGECRSNILFHDSRFFGSYDR